MELPVRGGGSPSHTPPENRPGLGIFRLTQMCRLRFDSASTSPSAPPFGVVFSWLWHGDQVFFDASGSFQRPATLRRGTASPPALSPLCLLAPLGRGKEI